MVAYVVVIIFDIHQGFHDVWLIALGMLENNVNKTIRFYNNYKYIYSLFEIHKICVEDLRFLHQFPSLCSDKFSMINKVIN